VTAFAVLLVSFVLGWRLAAWWVAPLIYVVLAFTLAVVIDPRADGGESDVSGWLIAVIEAVVPALAAAIGTVIGMARSHRRERVGGE
jgi:ABC-type dipeptide/oligopeptide/nickel transport system permease component